MIYAIETIGSGTRTRYTVKAVTETGTNPTNGKSYRTEDAALATAAYRDRLELTRDPGYRGKPVIYFVRIVRTYEDGTTERVLDEKYFGTERRKAFSRFAELKHQRPGIETMQDTDKRSWER